MLKDWFIRSQGRSTMTTQKKTQPLPALLCNQTTWHTTQLECKDVIPLQVRPPAMILFILWRVFVRVESLTGICCSKGYASLLYACLKCLFFVCLFVLTLLFWLPTWSILTRWGYFLFKYVKGFSSSPALFFVCVFILTETKPFPFAVFFAFSSQFSKCLFLKMHISWKDHYI